MTRTPYLKPEEMSAEQRRVYDDIVRSRGTWLNGPYAPLLQSPELADKAQAFGELVRYRTVIAPRLNELAILCTARHWDAQFEWYQHERIARREGLAEKVCTAIANFQVPLFDDEDERCIHAFCQELLQFHRVSDATYAAATARFGVRGVVELVAVMGYYSFIAMTLNAHEVPLPPGVAPPLPGRPPAADQGRD
jgi:4-carboxymuconolactone decarboxylase